MILHNPDYYVGGVFIPQTEEWKGRFHATSEELWRYAEQDVTTVEEYEIVLGLINAQQVYAIWWEKMQKEMKSRRY